MKYTIMGFSQKRLVELGLDLTDAMILRWVVDFCNTKSIIKIAHEGKMYLWISYKSLCDDLPILGIKKRAVAARLQKLDDAGILVSQLIKNPQGTFTCFAPNEDAISSLVSDGKGTYENDRGCRSNCNGGAVQTATKDPSTKRSFYNPPKGSPQVKFKKPSVDEIREYCDGRKNDVNPERFYDFYESKGWMVGKTKMRDWKASVRTWEKRDSKDDQQPANPIHRYLD